MKNCACPKLESCNATDTRAICVQGPNGCKLMRNACELERARCLGETWTNIDEIQCKNFKPNEQKACACPKLKGCLQGGTGICVKRKQGCKLMRDECELERARCNGEKCNKVDRLQCKGFQVGEEKQCACPRLQTCNKNETNICVQGAKGCKLLSNDCDLAKSQCAGEAWKVVDSLQCRNFSTGVMKNCSCPKLESCNATDTRAICVQGPNGCKLMRNACELERARCLGETWTNSDEVQCKNFKPNEQKACACPKLKGCSQTGTGICVKRKEGCKLMRDECELERARCNGERCKKVDRMQCKSFQVGEEKQCACPRLQTCNKNETNICAQGAKGCKLLRNDCDLAKAECAGEDWSPTAVLQCKNFTIDAVRACACPCLINCGNSTQVCGRNQNSCKLFKNECEMRSNICKGEPWTLTGLSQCAGLQLGKSRACACPLAQPCSKQRSVCARTGNRCKKFKSDCDFQHARCRGEVWRRTNNDHCCEFNSNEARVCSFTASRPVCGVANDKRSCRLFRTTCELRNANKNAKQKWRVTSRNSCKCFKRGQTKNCSRRPRCKRSVRMRSLEVCARRANQLTLFGTQCNLEWHNYNRCTEFQPVPRVECAKLNKRRKN